MQEQYHCVVPNGANLEGSAYLVESWRLGDVRDGDDDLAASVGARRRTQLASSQSYFHHGPVVGNSLWHRGQFPKQYDIPQLKSGGIRLQKHKPSNVTALRIAVHSMKHLASPNQFQTCSNSKDCSIENLSVAKVPTVLVKSDQ